MLNRNLSKSILALALTGLISACGSSDSGGGEESKNTAPVIKGSATTSIDVGQSYSFTPTASDDEQDVLTFSAIGLPTWLTLNASTGTLSGTAAEADIGSSQEIVISVSDGSATAALPGFTVTVQAKSNTTTLSGKVIDGYISGAQVFLDKNRNGLLDEGEPSASSDANGAYQLPLLEDDYPFVANSPIVALVGKGAKDITTGEEFDDSPLVLRAAPIVNFDPAKVKDFSQAISPFTTQVYSDVKDTLDLVIAGELEKEALSVELVQVKKELVDKLAAKLNIEAKELESSLFNDFLAAEIKPETITVISQQAVESTDALQEEKKQQIELEKGLKENQTAEVEVKFYSFIEWHSLETLYLKEVSEQKVLVETNGDKVTEWSSTKYRTSELGEPMLDSTGEALIYEVSSGVTKLNSDGSFEESMQWEVDKNADNQRLFKGQSYSVGTWTVSSKTYRQYFDESAVQVELPNWQGGLEVAKRIYNGGVLDIDALVAGTLTDIDFVQDFNKSTTFEDGKLIHLQKYDQYEPSMGAFDFDSANYSETRIDTKSADSVIHEVYNDWGADGSINKSLVRELQNNGTEIETTAQNIWPNLTDGDWQEYVEFNWATHGKTGPIWLEQTITKTMLDGKAVTISEGKRYLQDSKSNAAINAVDKEKYQLSSWKSTTTQRSPELSVEFVTWTNFHIEDELFTSPEANFSYDKTESGQKVAYSVKYENDLWLTWDFPEWGGQNITDLVAVVDAQLKANANDYSAVDISGLLVNGASTATQDWVHPTQSFVEDAQGQVRTWYVVTNVIDGELKLHETTLPELKEGWEVFFVPGGSKVYVPESFTFDDWNMTTSMVALPPISSFDTEKGSFSFEPGFGWNPIYPFHLYLDKSQAEAQFDKLKGMNGFSQEWLADKTLYAVWFGGGDDAQGVELDDVPVVIEVHFSANGEITSKGLLNTRGSDEVFHYEVSDNGLLMITEEQDTTKEGNRVVCGSTSDYIKTHFVLDSGEGEEFDNVDLYFFDKQKALDYAAGLDKSIPACVM